jgi:hypothetical protein
MNCLKIKNFQDLMNGQTKAKIICPIKQQVVITLTRQGDNVNLDSPPENITIPLNTEIRYEPWMMDRGSLLFKHQGKILKIATEFDIIEFENEQRQLAPADDIVQVDKTWTVTKTATQTQFTGNPVW